MVRVDRVEFHGYSDCIRLENDFVRVTLGHHSGGRVLEYSLGGKNALALDPGEAGATWHPGGPDIGVSAGRFDIGPEKGLALHPALWLGPWTAEVDAAGVARMTSPDDAATGARLVREFELDPVSSRLRCTQVITNVSAVPRVWFHWSRTFAPGGGICVVPLTPPSRFPNGYVMYRPDDTIEFAPVDPAIRTRDGFLEIIGTPRFPKLCIDSYAGWFAYLPPAGGLFVKRFPTFPDRMYGDVVAETVSIWYYKDQLCELEPIGPEERLAPGRSASFTEEWWVLPFEFPADRGALDLEVLADLVARETEAR